MEKDKKIAPETAISETNKINTNTVNIAHSAEKVKSVLTKNQCRIISDIYKHSQSAFELINGLSGLEFCDLPTAARVLVKQGYISLEDEAYILERNTAIGRIK